jgi:uncharacterized membrane protein YhaH (DUF805 family)
MPGSYFIKALALWNDYSNRARRAEFWGYTIVAWLLEVFAITLTAIMLNDAIDSEDMTFDSAAVSPVGWGVLYATLALGIALFFPWLAVTVRRMHDLGRSGWWALFLFIPGLVIVVWILALVDGQPMVNKYGADPKGRDVTKEY